MRTETIKGFYGSGRTRTEIYVYPNRGGCWYVADGGKTVNFTFDNVENGVNIEELNDSDCFTVNEPIESPEQLEEAVNN
jgi:hypothetical protein